MRDGWDGLPKLTEEDARNGWTLEKALAYQKARDIAAGLVGGNVVTEFKRERPPIQIENVRNWNPRKWLRG